MDGRNVLTKTLRTSVVLVPLFGQAFALNDNDLRVVLGVSLSVAAILMVIAIIFIVRYYKKLKETRQSQKRKDAQDMMMMRQRFGQMSPNSGITSLSGSRVPEVLVNGQHNPELQARLGKADWSWTAENGQVKRPTPALPEVNPQKPIATGVAKKVSKKKGSKTTESLPYPAPFKQSLYAKHDFTHPFEDQVVTVDMFSEHGDTDEREIDDDVFNEDQKPTTPTGDRKTFMMQQFKDELGYKEIHETRITSKGDGQETRFEDFVVQTNQNEIAVEVDPTKTIPSEIYYSERMYHSVERPKPTTPSLPDVEVVVELVEMVDFSSLVYAADIEREYALLAENNKEVESAQKPEAKRITVDFTTQCTSVNILAETRGTVQKVNIPSQPPPPPPPQPQPFSPPPISVAQQQPVGVPIPQPIPQPEPTLYYQPMPVILPVRGPPIEPQKTQQRERPKSVKSNKSGKSSKSKKSNKSKRSKKTKMVERKKVQKSDFVGQCHEDEIVQATGFVAIPDINPYAAVQKPVHIVPPVPSKNYQPAEIVTRAEKPKEQSPTSNEEGATDLLIPDMALFDMGEDAMRHHHVRLKKPSESTSPYLHDRHDSGSMSDDQHQLSADAADRVSAAFASIFQDHSRCLTSDSSEDELDRPRTPRKPSSRKETSERPTLTQDKLISEQLDTLDRQEHQAVPEPKPSTSRIGPIIEPNRLRHDESHDEDDSNESNPKYRRSGRDVEKDYEHNWDKLIDDTLPTQDY